MRFIDIYGQNEIKERLIHSVQTGRMPHALLFHGPQGTGKLALAIAYAQYISCENRGENDSCGQCPSCVQFQKLIHPDLHFTFPVIATQHRVSNGAIKEWREFVLKSPYISYDLWSSFLLQGGGGATPPIIPVTEATEIVSELNKTPYKSDFRIQIVCFPEKMNVQCANKLLKIIEEPYPNTHFLFVSENSDQILGTILSRLQSIYVPALPPDVVTEILKKQYPTATEKAITDTVHIANGNIIKAFDVIENGEETQMFLTNFIYIMRTCYTKNILGMKKWSEEVAKWTRKQQITFLSYAQRMIRENFIFNIRQKELNYMTSDESGFSEKFSPFINERNICQFLSELELAERHIERNGQAKIILFDLALKITMLLKM